MRLRLLSEGATVEAADPDDWEAAEAVEQIFRMHKLNVDRDKHLSLVARLDGDVVGGVFSGWTRDGDQDAYAYSFDIAVHPRIQGLDLAGLRLIDAALRQYEDEREAYGDRTYISLYVVNPRLADYYERRYGFQVDAEYKHGSKHMSRY